MEKAAGRQRKVYHIAALMVLCATGTSAQDAPFGFSAKGGGSALSWFGKVDWRESSSPSDALWTVGMGLEFRFTPRVALVADGLYRRLDTWRGGGAMVSRWSETEKGSLWEFPAQLKYRFSGPGDGFRPFVTAGGSAGILRTKTDGGGVILYPGMSQHYSETRSTRETIPGAVAGGGVERRIGRALLGIEGRYTYWFYDNVPAATRTIRGHQLTYLLSFGL